MLQITNKEKLTHTKEESTKKDFTKTNWSWIPLAAAVVATAAIFAFGFPNLEAYSEAVQDLKQTHFTPK